MLSIIGLIIEISQGWRLKRVGYFRFAGNLTIRARIIWSIQWLKHVITYRFFSEYNEGFAEKYWGKTKKTLFLSEILICDGSSYLSFQAKSHCPMTVP